MGRTPYHKKIGYEIVARFFDVFQQFIERKCGVVLVPFFHVLFGEFIKQLQKDHGSYYKITDYSEYECQITAGAFQTKETIFTFVLNGKMVNIRASYKNLDVGALYRPDVFRMICKFDMYSNSKDALTAMCNYFEEFIEQQGFDEINREAVSIITIDPKAKRIDEEIRLFYQ